MHYRISACAAPALRSDRLGPGSVVAVMGLDAKILTVSESASVGAREDRSSDELARVLVEHGFRIVDRRVVPDGTAPVSTALVELSAGFAGLIVTTGGTGFSPTDVTPEATRVVLEREAPGLAEAMRSVSPLGRLSRGLAGSVGSCLILNVPGSPRGAVESVEAVVDVPPTRSNCWQGADPIDAATSARECGSGRRRQGGEDPQGDLINLMNGSLP